MYQKITWFISCSKCKLFESYDDQFQASLAAQNHDEKTHNKGKPTYTCDVGFMKSTHVEYYNNWWPNYYK